MPVSESLSAIVADVNVMIATGAAPGRAELEVLRRNLSFVAGEARRAETGATATQLAARELIEGVETRVVDLAGLARRTREHVGVAA